MTHCNGILSESNPDPLPPQTLLLIHLSQFFVLSLSICCCHFVGYVCSFQKPNSKGLCCARCCTNIMRPSPKSYILKRYFSPLMIPFLSLFSSVSLAGALMKAVAWLQTCLLLPSQQTGLSYWRRQNYSGFMLWVTDSRMSSPLSLFKKQS